MTRALFIGILLIILITIDWYIFKGIKSLIRDWSNTNQTLITFGYWSIPIICLSLIFITYYVLIDKLSFQTKSIIASFVLIIYLSKFITAFILIIGDFFVLFKKTYASVSEVFSSSNPKDHSTRTVEPITRSEFLTKTALAVGATHIGAMSWGIISGAYDYRIRRVPLILPNLPKQFNGLKLIQISDIHSGSFYNKTAVEGGVDMLLKEKPDMVFFTGDLVNNKAEELKEDYFNIFKRVSAPLGVYSVFGNHDYGDYTQWPSQQAKMQNLKDLAEAHKLMGWNLLMDEHNPITVDGESIGVLGIQNWGAGFAQHGDLNKALIGTEQYSTKLLLSHDPSHWRAQVLDKANIDASFAGHTHGMQYGVEIGDFKWSPVQWRYKEWAGLYKENNQQLYVNRGYGFLGYPGRIGILPEITVFELKTA
jgi:uncharacterized protein